MVIKYTSPALKAINILEADKIETVNIQVIYYCKKVNGCVVEFSSNGINDTACIYLDDKKIGYESIFDEICKESEKIRNNPEISNEDKRQDAINSLKYPYNPIWIYNIHVKDGISSGDWEIVYK